MNCSSSVHSRVTALGGEAWTGDAALALTDDVAGPERRQQQVGSYFPNNLSLPLDLEAVRNDDIPVITYLSVVPLLQAIAMTIDGAPGILQATVTPHFRAQPSRDRQGASASNSSS
jgi:hypothetical protein